MSKSVSVSIHTPIRARGPYHDAGKGEDITLIAELTSSEGLTGPSDPYPFLPHASNDVEVVHQEFENFYHGLIGRYGRGTRMRGQNG